MLLKFEEHAVGETPHSRSTTVAVDYGKLQWMFHYGVNRGFDCQSEAPSKVGADIVIPCPSVQQVLIRLRGPYDWGHGFLNRPALTCCQGITSEGFC
jgi:hypothetical protein